MMNFWVIGFLWGSARFSGEYLLAQNLNKAFLETIKQKANIANKIFETTTTTGKTSYRLKINPKNKHVAYMINNGYEGRIGNEERLPPKNMTPEQEHEFLKGYFCTHFTFDITKNKNKTYPRLRFYAAQGLLDLLNQHLHQEISTTIKKISPHSNNDVCKVLYFQSKKEVPAIIEFLDLEVDNFE